MILRKPTSRWALWVFAAALLLKAAMPMLANASAQAQGKTLVEVCTAYGVSLVSLDGQPNTEHGAPTDHTSDHAADHCALNALTAFAAVAAVPLAVAQVSFRETASPPTRAASRPVDACADWIARLKHGPPVFA
jgi:hypothetical protein